MLPHFNHFKRSCFYGDGSHFLILCHHRRAELAAGGAFQFDLVAWICGGQAAVFARILYSLVGVAGLWECLAPVPSESIAAGGKIIDHNFLRRSFQMKEVNYRDVAPIVLEKLAEGGVF